MTIDADKLYELLPAIYRIRDEEHAGALRALIGVLAEQATVLEESLAQLYDDQFIETCAPWVVPYIGDLIGYRPLHARVARVGGPRAEVAHTIAFRRRKGTAAMLEQLARDVTGWDAHVVEYFQLLATTQYMNHVRRRAVAWADLRDWRATFAQRDSAFDTLARTSRDACDLRRRSGRYNIPNIGIFLWRLMPLSAKLGFLAPDPLDAPDAGSASIRSAPTCNCSGAAGPSQTSAIWPTLSMSRNRCRSGLRRWL